MLLVSSNTLPTGIYIYLCARTCLLLHDARGAYIISPREIQLNPGPDRRRRSTSVFFHWRQKLATRVEEGRYYRTSAYCAGIILCKSHYSRLTALQPTVMYSGGGFMRLCRNNTWLNTLLRRESGATIRDSVNGMRSLAVVLIISSNYVWFQASNVYNKRVIIITVCIQRQLWLHC